MSYPVRRRILLPSSLQTIGIESLNMVTLTLGFDTLRFKRNSAQRHILDTLLGHTVGLVLAQF